MSDELSEYELRQQQNKRENMEKLRQLGLLSEPTRADGNEPEQAGNPKKKKRATPENDGPNARRTSGRERKQPLFLFPASIHEESDENDESCDRTRNRKKVGGKPRAKPLDKSKSAAQLNRVTNGSILQKPFSSSLTTIFRPGDSVCPFLKEWLADEKGIVHGYKLELPVCFNFDDRNANSWDTMTIEGDEYHGLTSGRVDTLVWAVHVGAPVWLKNLLLVACYQQVTRGYCEKVLSDDLGRLKRLLVTEDSVQLSGLNSRLAALQKKLGDVRRTKAALGADIARRPPPMSEDDVEQLKRMQDCLSSAESAHARLKQDVNEAAMRRDECTRRLEDEAPAKRARIEAFLRELYAPDSEDGPPLPLDR